jgi:hypothetical protein
VVEYWSVGVKTKEPILQHSISAITFSQSQFETFNRIAKRSGALSNTGAMHPEKPGGIRRCLRAIANGANDLLLLVRAQFGRATHLDSAIARGGQARPGPFTDFWNLAASARDREGQRSRVDAWNQFAP